METKNEYLDGRADALNKLYASVCEVLSIISLDNSAQRSSMEYVLYMIGAEFDAMPEIYWIDHMEMRRHLKNSKK